MLTEINVAADALLHFSLAATSVLPCPCLAFIVVSSLLSRLQIVLWQLSWMAWQLLMCVYTLCSVTTCLENL